MIIIRILSVILVIFGINACHSTKTISQSDKEFRVAFYNVENVFDTIDDPNTIDEYFTPDGEAKWDEKRFREKLSRISEVYTAMGEPAIFGVAEVENAYVVKEIGDSCALEGFIHQDSPDKRGIDVALMYDNVLFTLIDSHFIRIQFPDSVEADYTSRDILHASLKHKDGYVVNVFVNHWPSRRGGTEASSPKRELVSKYLQDDIKSHLKLSDLENVIVMGDFNDEPENASVQSLLNRTRTEDFELINLMSREEFSDKGSYNYRGKLNLLDQFIVSRDLINPKGISVYQAEIFKREFLVYKDKKNGDKPSRTYGGPNYYGGYSDHYPILLTLRHH